MHHMTILDTKTMYPFQKYIEQYAIVVGVCVIDVSCTCMYQNITHAVCMALLLNIFLKRVHGFSILCGHMMHSEAIALGFKV